ncbi:GNAT family N-acetyltransferase [Bacillus sp. Marseille-P3800]|uniref:GNAT family N-acetyltransferase n=1 Tax=Bacillus sp. Marseille-P3800 TaxID=2014782 RepID=UPI000C088F6A|nr:GNAT family N-acetyltransferase [Bacillus sp. Marseille-P3800]
MIRMAQLEDAQGIATVHVHAWLTTYTGIIKEEILARMSIEGRTTLWKRHLNDREQLIYVYEQNEDVVGFASATKSTANVLTLYILKDYQGKGGGKALLKALFKDLVDLNHQEASVAVLEANNSKLFYEKMGASLKKRTDVPEYGAGNVLLTYTWNELTKA